MQFLTKEAVTTYLILNDIAFTNYLITEEAYKERFYVLLQLVDPSSKDFSSVKKIAEGKFGNNREELLAKFHYREDSGESIERSRTGEGYDANGSRSPEDDFDPEFHLITKSAGKISKWEFHRTDTDFFPSIPHGHSILNHKIKLDAYLGYIYKNNVQVDRERRQFIIDLWNDKDFRQAANETINFYMKTFPMFNWRVANPLKLPKRRKRIH